MFMMCQVWQYGATLLSLRSLGLSQAKRTIPSGFYKLPPFLVIRLPFRSFASLLGHSNHGQCSSFSAQQSALCYISIVLTYRDTRLTCSGTNDQMDSVIQRLNEWGRGAGFGGVFHGCVLGWALHSLGLHWSNIKAMHALHQNFRCEEMRL